MPDPLEERLSAAVAELNAAAAALAAQGATVVLDARLPYGWEVLVPERGRAILELRRVYPPDHAGRMDLEPKVFP